MKEKGESLFFNDGYVFEKNIIFIASQLHGDSGSDFSRVSTIINDKWTFADFEDAALSVTVLPERVALYLGHNGNVLAVGKGNRGIEVLPDVAKHGKILRIRTIGQNAYACGMSGMVYRRTPKGWVHMDDGLLGKDGLDLEDIGGSGPNDIYAVGLPGSICHFDGKRWKRLESPTNRPLSGVKVVSKDQVYLCGDDGQVFEGNRKGWKDIGIEDSDQDFWGIEYFQEAIHVSYDSGILVRNGKDWDEVDFHLKGEVDCHRLHANDGVLWSFGIDTILRTDGKQWVRVDQPDVQ